MAAVINERVVIRDALPTLAVVCVLIVAFGILSMLDRFTRALFGTLEGAVGWIPFAGKVLKAPIAKIEQKISNALGWAIDGIAERIGASFYKLSKIVRMMARELAMTAAMGLVIAGAMGKLVPWADLLEHLRRRFDPFYKRDKAHDARLNRQGDQIRAGAEIVGARVIPRIQVVEARAATLEFPARRRARARERANAQALSNVWKWIRTHPRALPSLAFVGVVAWSLGRMGAGWIRCSNWRRLGKRVCNIPSDVFNLLLGIGTVTFLVTDLCAVLSAVRRVASEFEPYLTALLLEVEGHICGGPEGAPSGIVASDWQRVAARPSST